MFNDVRGLLASATGECGSGLYAAMGFAGIVKAWQCSHTPHAKPCISRHKFTQQNMLIAIAKKCRLYPCKLQT